MVVAIIVASLSTAMAQKGEMAGGIQLNYGTEIESVGLGAKFQYGVTNAIRIEPSLDYFFGKSGGNMFAVNLNAHYLFNVANKINIYPLVGIGYTSWKIGGVNFDYDDSIWEGYDYSNEDLSDDWGTSSSSRMSKVAINIGAGIGYQLTDKLAVNAELKYQIISNFNQLVIGVGTTYKF